MKKSPLLLAFFLAAAGSAQNQSKKNSQPGPERPGKIIAAQVQQLDCQTREQLAVFFRGLKAAGFNTVILRLFQNPGDGFHGLCVPGRESGFYFRTGSAPMVCDILETAADEAHKAGLHFFAWVNSRYADYGIEDRFDLHGLAYDFETKSYQASKGLSIFHPEVQARLIAIYRDLAAYPIDGVLVQDDLIMRHNEDFSAAAVLLYQKELGKRLSPDGLFQEVKLIEGKAHVGNYSAEFQAWQEWKAKKLLDLADRLRQSVRSQNPAIKFGFNFYYETGLKPDKGLAWFSQDVKMAGQRKYDFYSLMLYHRQMGDELGLSGPELENAASLAAGNFIAALPGLEPVIKFMAKDFKGSGPLPETELERVVSKIEGRDRAGVAFFPVSRGMEKALAQAIANWEGKDEKDNQRGAACRGTACGVQAQER